MSISNPADLILNNPVTDKSTGWYIIQSVISARSKTTLPVPFGVNVMSIFSFVPSANIVVPDNVTPAVATFVSKVVPYIVVDVIVGIYAALYTLKSSPIPTPPSTVKAPVE